MSEWFKELVLKTSDTKVPRVRISVSPPYIGTTKVVPIIFIRRSTQVGRRGRFAKPLGRELPAQGFESLLLRQKTDIHFCEYLFFIGWDSNPEWAKSVNKSCLWQVFSFLVRRPVPKPLAWVVKRGDALRHIPSSPPKNRYSLL